MLTIRKKTIFKIKEAIDALNPSDPNRLGENELGHSDTSYLFDSLIKLIQENKKAEEEILKLSKAVDQNPASIVITNTAGDIEYVNRKFCDLTGYTKEEIIGKNPRILKSENNPAELFRELWGTILSGNEWRGELQNKKKNGELYWESAQISPIFNENHRITHYLAIKEDITQRRVAELERQRQTGLITSLLDSIPDIIFFKDTEGVYLGCNPPFTQYTGRSRDEIIGKTDYDLFDRESADLFRYNDQKMLEQKISRHNEEWITYPDGRKILIDTLKTPYWGGDGELLGLLGISRDITKRKYAEDALQQSSRKWEAIISASPDGIGMVSLDGKLRLMSEKLALMHGYSVDQRDNLLNKTIFDFIDPSCHEMLNDNIQKLFGGTIDHKITEYLAVRQDNSRFFIDVNSTLLYDANGNPESLLFVERDVTERKQAADTMQQISARLALATRAGGVGVWDLDLQNDLLIWDDQMFALHGIEKRDIYGSYKEWLAVIFPDDILKVDQQIKMAIKGETEFDTEFRVTWPDGSVHNIRAIANVQRDNMGVPLHIIGTNWDISMQKKTEATLLIAKQESDSANRAKSEFLANMSHEIRTPLNGVIGFTDLLLRTPLNKIQKQYAKNANTSGYSLLGIINDILDFSKIEAGKMDIDLIKGDIIELAELTCDIVKYHASQKNIELLLNIGQDIPRFALIDPTRLKQILVNLLGNAVKFTETGEVELKISFVKTEQNRGEFLFSVKDIGIGISEEQQRHLFKAFTQADTSTTRRFGGTGLGLTISNMLAEKMGTKIEVVSELNKGSNFFFTLNTSFELGEKPDLSRLKSIKRILVIDDNFNSRMILEHTFRYWGIEFVGLENGNEAILLLEKSKPFDVILVDYQMPEINGIETIRLIRNQLNLTAEKQPVILLHSSSDDIEIYEECKRLGVIFNLTKPVKSSELLHYLKSVHHNLVPATLEDEFGSLIRAVALTNNSTPGILVAEDVDINMNLVTTVIKQMIPDAIIYEAKNGQEAFEMTILNKPNLIIMDIQMPVMSGIKSTMAIRKFESGEGSRIPIVALTAGAIKGEEESCIAAGIDDFLTKPLDHKKLQLILEKHLSIFYKQSAFTDQNTGREIGNLHFDRTLFLEGLNGNKALGEELLIAVQVQFDKDLKLLGIAIKERDFHLIKNVAHAIKGTCLNLWFNKMAELAIEIELFFGTAYFNELEELYHELLQEWEQVQALITKGGD